MGAVVLNAGRCCSCWAPTRQRRRWCSSGTSSSGGGAGAATHGQRRRRLAVVVAASAADGPSTSGSSSSEGGDGSSTSSSSSSSTGGVRRGGAPDPYVAAARRLQALTENVGDGEEELMEQMLLEESPENKLAIQVVLGALVLTSSTTICWLCDADPAGGASLSLASLRAAAVGAAAALPLVAYKSLTWGAAARGRSATLGALRRMQVDHARPWIAGMSQPQLVLHLLLDTLPLLFLMLPAAQAGLTTSFAFTSAALGPATGVQLPRELGFALALGFTAFVRAGVSATDYVQDPEQVQVVGDAVANADRFYKLQVASSTGAGAGAGAGGAEGGADAEAARASRAFKAVAVAWREQAEEVATLFAVLSVLELLLLGGLFYATKDMTAVCVAALLAQAVEYNQISSEVSAPPGGSGSGSGSSSGGKGGGGNGGTGGGGGTAAAAAARPREQQRGGSS